MSSINEQVRVPTPAPIPTKPIPIRASGSNQPGGSTNYKISVRFGDQLLQAGFTSVPNLVLNHYAQLGITPAEMLFTIHMWQFRWTERAPFPSLTTIAYKMNVSWRQAHRYAKSLEHKGFLFIRSRAEPGRGQVTSEYDFEPLLKAVLKLDKEPQITPTAIGNNGNSISQSSGPTPLTQMTEGGVTELSEAPLSPMSGEEYIVEEDPSQEDANHSNSRKVMPENDKEERRSVGVGRDRSVPSLPTSVRDEVIERTSNGSISSTARRTGGIEAIGSLLSKRHAQGSRREIDPESRQVIQAYVESFASDLSDHASLKSSTTRTVNLFRQSGLSIEAFIRQMYKARSITNERSTATTMSRVPRSGGTSVRAAPPPAKRKMAYWFSVLEDQLGLRSTKVNIAQGRVQKGVQELS